MAQREVIEKVRKYILLLVSKGIPIEKAFLYGSYARNEATEHSDIDVMLVSDYFESGIKAKSQPWRYATEIDGRIEPLSVSLKKFLNDDGSPIIEVVRQEGIEIKI